jgi:DNA-binding LacI/PurR family transcriptional regulator
MLREEGIPFVLLGRCEDNTGISYVDTDLRQTMDNCFSYLTGNGRYSIAYIFNENDEYGFSVRAVREYYAACQRYNTTPILKAAQLTPEDGEIAMNTLLESHPGLDAAIIYSDIPAMGAVKAVQSKGHHIPGDFSIICQEHSIISNLESFSPVVIDICADEMAAQAAQLMINQLEGKPIAQPQLLVPSKLIINERDSS